MKAFWVTFFQLHIVKNVLKISSVVGTLLNIVNQESDVVPGLDIPCSQAVLNYCIPYFVASYSAAKNENDRNKVHGHN